MCVKLIIIGSPLRAKTPFVRQQAWSCQELFIHRLHRLIFNLRNLWIKQLLGVVAGAVTDFEFFFFQLGICDLDGDFPVGAVALFIGR
jgi:hypothetical protein